MPMANDAHVRNPRRVEAGKRNRLRRGLLTLQGRERLRQAALRNQPWTRSTGPRTAVGKAVVARNGKARQEGAISVRELWREIHLIWQAFESRNKEILKIFHDDRGGSLK
jgi:hypothetical protein